MKIILASASPRRRELLAQIGLEFTVMVSDAEENTSSKIPYEIVCELSKIKADAVVSQLIDENGLAKKVDDNFSNGEEYLFIGADTIVELDGEILGKPKSEEMACDMLMRLQGRSHNVFTGVTLVHISNEGQKVKTFYEKTEVIFAPMTREEIEFYVATKDPMDKAGAYGIQGLCARYIQGIKGDYNNVVGLPVGRLYKEAREFL